MSLRSKKKTRAHLESLRQKAISRGEKLFVAVAHKTNQHIYLQLRDDQGRIVFGASSLSPELRSSCSGVKGTEAAEKVGTYFAEKVKALGIEGHQMAFDRSGFPFMGRIAALKKGLVDAGIHC